MAYPFTPPNRAALWARLSLTRVQVAALCGVSVGQVGHWTRQGYLPRSTRDPEHYSGVAVDLAILIKQGLRQGLVAHEAAERARAYLAAERSRQPDLHALDAEALTMIATQVAQAEAAARQVLAVVAPLTPSREIPSRARQRPVAWRTGARRGTVVGGGPIDSRPLVTVRDAVRRRVLDSRQGRPP